VACAAEHSQSKDETAAFLEIPVPRTRVCVEPGPVVSTAFPSRCRHCDPAPCLQVCPTGAISRDVEHGLVLVDASRFGRRLVEPGFGMAGVVWDAMQPGSFAGVAAY